MPTRNNGRGRQTRNHQPGSANPLLFLLCAQTICNFKLILVIYSWQKSRIHNQPMANMRIYFFSDAGWEQRLQTEANQLIELFHLLAADTPTSDLVLAVYFLRHSTWSGGVAFAHDWLTPAKFISQRGRWNFTQFFYAALGFSPPIQTDSAAIRSQKQPLSNVPDRHLWLEVALSIVQRPYRVSVCP